MCNRPGCIFLVAVYDVIMTSSIVPFSTYQSNFEVFQWSIWVSIPGLNWTRNRLLVVSDPQNASLLYYGQHKGSIYGVRGQILKLSHGRYGCLFLDLIGREIDCWWFQIPKILPCCTMGNIRGQFKGSEVKF